MRSTPAQLARIAAVVAGLVVSGKAGHVALEGLGWHAAHHAFHVAYGGGALVAFLAYVGRDVRRHGTPRFSWSLRPDAEPTPGR